MPAQTARLPSNTDESDTVLTAVIIGVIAGAAMLWKTFMFQDWFSIAAAVVACGPLMLVGVIHLADNCHYGTPTTWLPRAARWTSISCTVFALTTILIAAGPPGTKSGVRMFVNDDTFKIKTSLQGTFMLVNPVWTRAYDIPERLDYRTADVPNSRGVAMGVPFEGYAVHFEIKDDDGVPQTCGASARGFILDRRDPARLEKTLAEIVRLHGDPKAYMEAQLLATIQVAATHAYDRNRQGKPKLNEFLMGQEIGAVMTALALRWAPNHDVSPPYSCRVIHRN